MSANGAPDAGKVNALSDDIFRQRHDRQLDPKLASRALEARVARLEAQHQLTPDRASAFRAQLQELQRSDAKAVGPRLNLLRAQLDAVTV